MNKLLKIIICLCLGFSVTAYAALDLELTQGVDKAVPIAILPFVGGGNVVSVINSDLKNSGQFRVSSTIPAGTKPADYSYWQQQKINYVVTGKESCSWGSCKVSFQLLDVYGKSVLLQQQFSISKASMRALAHHVSDLIYQQILGQKGIFSTRIAYILVVNPATSKPQYKLMVADADGYNPQTILSSPDPIMSPAWSPDGKKIVYVSFEHNRAAIYLQNLSNGKRELISRFPGINGAPSWSPDGTRLALVLTKTGYPKIYVLNLADGSLQQVTSGRALDTEPSWSPDGKSLIFTSNRGGAPQIYQVSLGNKQVTRLTYQGNYNARASFTPDGKSIVMLHRDSGMYNIAVQNLASGRVDVLTKFGMDESPSVAPNGEMIVYATNYAGRGVLGEVSIDGSVKLRLPAQDGAVQEPTWSPFLN